MNAFLSALWAEALKAYRSRVALITLAVITVLPIMAGFFMIILKNPEQAKVMGLIGTKAQLTAGTADWPSFLYVILIGSAAAGAILYAFITAWLFGREFSDHTAKELLALPTPRWVIVLAKFALLAVWIAVLSAWVFGVGMIVGRMVDIPGAYAGMEANALGYAALIAALSYMLMPLVAWIASMGRGFIPPLAFAITTLGVTNLANILGWADWFPWAIPILVASQAGPKAEYVGPHSFVIVVITFVVGLAATFYWWQSADQTK
jgi:ABC-2 type transport system permease protein